MPPAPTVKATKKKTTKKEEVVQEQKEEVRRQRASASKLVILTARCSFPPQEPATIKPADQLVLTEKELDEDVAR
jgi:hypothetical protein